MVYLKVVMLGAICEQEEETSGASGVWCGIQKRLLVCQQKKNNTWIHVVSDYMDMKFIVSSKLYCTLIFLYASSRFKCPSFAPVPAKRFLRAGPTRASSLSATKRAAEVYGRDLHRRPSPCRLRPREFCQPKLTTSCEPWYFWNISRKKPKKIRKFQKDGWIHHFAGSQDFEWMKWKICMFVRELMWCGACQSASIRL